MKKTYFLFTAMMSTSLSFNALAEGDLAYTSIELNYVNMDIDGFDNRRNYHKKYDDGDGWGLGGSFGFAENWFVFANYSSTESDVDFVDDRDQFYSSDTDIERVDLGFGFHMPINSQTDHTDLVFRGAYVDIDVDGFKFGQTSSSSLSNLRDDSSDGFLADASVRSQLNSWLEGSVGLRYTDIEQVDNFSLIGNLLFEISPQIGFNLGVDAGDELRTWLAGARLSF